MPDSIGLATSDITTGEFLITEVSSERELIDEINKFTPSEILLMKHLQSAELIYLI